MTDGGYERNGVVYLFDVAITLTDAGLAAGPGFGLAPVGVVFEFLKLLQQSGPQQCASAPPCPAHRTFMRAVSCHIQHALM